MPNHFHFLLRIKEKEKLMMLPDFPKFRTLENLISKRFSHYFSSYTQAFNKQEKRKGSLFIKNFKRSPVTDKKYLQKLVHYIHYNPVEAGLASKPQEWKYSSYNAILSSRPTLVLKEEVIEWFGDLENFIYCHKFPPKETGIEKF
jgi:REP element-mobilizing transposase RayT